MAPTVTAPVRVPPWDEPWVRALGLSKPMFITLYDAEFRGSDQVRMLYPGGQWRLIRAGLYRRGSPGARSTSRARAGPAG